MSLRTHYFSPFRHGVEKQAYFPLLVLLELLSFYFFILASLEPFPSLPISASKYLISSISWNASTQTQPHLLLYLFLSYYPRHVLFRGLTSLQRLSVHFPHSAALNESITCVCTSPRMGYSFSSPYFTSSTHLSRPYETIIQANVKSDPRDTKFKIERTMRLYQCIGSIIHEHREGPW